MPYQDRQLTDATGAESGDMDVGASQTQPNRSRGVQAAIVVGLLLAIGVAAIRLF